MLRIRGRLLTAAVLLTVVYPNFATDIIRIPIPSPGADALFQVHYGKKWGYIDRTGKIVISPEFDDEGDFFDGLAKVRLGLTWGYIDETGHLAIGYRFAHAGDFSEGVAPVQVGRRWGFINRNGEVVIQPQFQAASKFRDGLARVEIWDTTQCDQSTYTKENAPLYAYSIDSRVGCFSQNARFGSVDHDGFLAIPATYRLAGDFSEGLAPIRSAAAKYGYIDKTNRLVIKPQFDQALPFSEDLAAVEVVGVDHGKTPLGIWGFVGRTGSLAIELRFYEARSFSEGLAPVALGADKWGYVNKGGAFVIPPRYSEAQPFSDGLAMVLPGQNSSPEDLFGYYIDKSGKRALILKESPSWPFFGGLTVAGRVGARKYIDRRGTIVAPYEVNPEP